MAADAKQKQAKKRSLCLINEYLKPVFNAAEAMQIVFQRSAKVSRAYQQVHFFHCRDEAGSAFAGDYSFH